MDERNTHLENPQVGEVLNENGGGYNVHESKRLVEEGYDQIALQYLKCTTSTPSPRIEYLHKLLKYLPQHSRVLELGCGAGIPATQLLDQYSQVTANDISATQLALAKQHVPEAKLIHSDMMSLSFSASTYDAVVALYSIIHLPRAEQEILMARISNWLCPGGYFLINLGTRDDPGSIEQDWLGSKMYWSGFDEKTNREMVRRGGFEFLDTKIIVEEEDEKLVPFLWILAKKGSK